ncbi:MAG: hypothetical protein PWR10_923 [Halanaerobiales bacterium]|nr:hypothetical protein [Halanaerobiales bacterium]
MEVWVVAIVFIFTYCLIVLEKITKATAAFSGGILLVVLKIISQEEAFEFIDFNTIGLLIGMMLIVGITRETGLFQYIAIKAAKWAGGEPKKIMIGFGLITAIASALLDNVTTVLLIAPVTMVISETMDINPIPFLMIEILMANIGGTATLIGDPPNIMIGSSADLSFISFITNLSPVVLLISALVVLLMLKMYKKELEVSKRTRVKIRRFDEGKAIKDRKLMYQSLFVLSLVMLAFMFHDLIGIETASVALAGAALLLLISDIRPEHVFREIEWPTIFFFAGLFVLVGGLEKVGIIDWLARSTLNITKGHFILTTLFLLWVSALASTIIDNIPFVATMIPLIHAIGQAGGPGLNIQPLWWALSLGACLGGNGSLVGASANLVVAGIAEKNHYTIDFRSYLKVGFPIMIMSIIIATIYVYLRYLI